jgi:hypothetical protein
MKVIIEDVRTTALSLPHLEGIQDATIRHRVPARTQCFVHVYSDQALIGLGPGGGAQAAREVIEQTLKPIEKAGVKTDDHQDAQT